MSSTSIVDWLNERKGATAFQSNSHSKEAPHQPMSLWTYFVMNVLLVLNINHFQVFTMSYMDCRKLKDLLTNHSFNCNIGTNWYGPVYGKATAASTSLGWAKKASRNLLAWRAEVSTATAGKEYRSEFLLVSFGTDIVRDKSWNGKSVVSCNLSRSSTSASSRQRWPGCAPSRKPQTTRVALLNLVKLR